MLKILKLKNIIGIILILGILAGLGYTTYYFLNHKDNVLYFKGETVTWKGEQVSSIKVDEGQEITLPIIEKEGYDFIGWYYDQAFTEPCGDSIVAQKGRMTIYANLQVKHFVVTLKYLNYDEPTVYEAPYEHSFQLINDIVPNVGYDIIWVDKATGEKVSNKVVVKNDLFYEQREVPKSYTLNYYNNNNAITYTKQVVYNENIDEVYITGSDVEITGYTLNGWHYKDKTGRNIAISQGVYLDENMIKSATVSGDISIYGEYSINSYLLVFEDENENEVKSLSIAYGSNLGDVLNNEKEDDTSLLQKSHQTIVGFKYTNGQSAFDFTNVTMPAMNIFIQTIYEYDTYNIWIKALFNDNIVPLSNLVVDYGSSLSSNDFPTESEIESIVDNYEDWDGYSKFDEYELDYYSIENDLGEYTLQEVLDMFTSIDDDKTILLNYYKDKFFIEYYTEPELITLHKRVEITTRDNFTIEGQILSDEKNVEFGGWAFAKDDTMLLEYDSFDLVNIGEDVKVFADFYKYDLDFWEYQMIDGNLFVTKYTGGYENIIVPAQIQGVVYGIGDGINSILRTGVSSNVKRILIPESVQFINSKAFYNNDILVRFRNINGGLNEVGELKDNAKLTIAENAFSSSTINENGEGAKSISTIKLPTRTYQIDEGAFAGAIDLNYINVSENCQSYYTDNGVLYKYPTSLKGKQLVAFPSQYKYGNEYTLPSDVERICKMAFSTNYVSNQNNNAQTKQPVLISFIIESGNSLKSIGDKAFYGNYQIKNIDMSSLPNLESIGSDVFNSCFTNNKTGAYLDENNNNVYCSMNFDFNGLKQIPTGFLAYTKYLRYLNLANVSNINEVKDYAFYNFGSSISESFSFNFDLSGNYKQISDYAFSSTKMKLTIGGLFKIDNADQSNNYIGNYAFSNSNIYYSGNGNPLVLSNIVLGIQAFSNATFNGSLTINSCTYLGDAYSYGYQFNGLKVTGDMAINNYTSSSNSIYLFINGHIYGNFEINILDSTFKRYELYYLTVDGDVTIDFVNGNGSISGYSLYNLKCNKLLLKNLKTLETNAFGYSYSSYYASEPSGSTYAPKIIEFDNDTCSITELKECQFGAMANLQKIILCKSIVKMHANTFTYTWTKRIKESSNGNYIYTNERSALKGNIQVVIMNRVTPIEIVGGNYFLVNSTINTNENNGISFYIYSSMISQYQNRSDWSTIFSAGKVNTITD